MIHAPAVRLARVGKTYGNGTVAVSDVSLDIASGEFLSLVGPSGCGKSTLLRMIAGLGAPTSGAIEWPGGAARDVGFVFQEPTLMPWSTVAANVRIPLTLKRAPRRAADERVAEALDMVGLSAFAGAYPRELSGGMKMRVSIARALVTHPAVLLMDEPFAALDEITRFKLNDDLLALWERQRWTVVFVTHSVFESVFLSTRIAVMAANPGRVVETIDIGVPTPRGAAFRTSADYAALTRTVSESLARAMA